MNVTHERPVRLESSLDGGKKQEGLTGLGGDSLLLPAIPLVYILDPHPTQHLREGCRFTQALHPPLERSRVGRRERDGRALARARRGERSGGRRGHVMILPQGQVLRC